MPRTCAVLVAVAALLLTAPAAADAAAGDVRVWDTGGARPVPCPAIEVDRRGDLTGGCALEVSSGDFAIVIRTVVGDMEFGSCPYGYEMLVDGSGRTKLVDVAPGGQSPCNDMRACNRDDVKPWSGRIEAGPDGRLTHVVQACFDTCMGQFSGELRLGLSRIGDSWRQTADRALVGDSGYQLDGSWDIEQRDLDIRPVGSAGGGVTGAWRLTGEPVGWPI